MALSYTVRHGKIKDGKAHFRDQAKAERSEKDRAQPRNHQKNPPALEEN
jgi:hypothetical protein